MNTNENRIWIGLFMLVSLFFYQHSYAAPTEEAMPLQILHYINEYRVAHGLNTLKMNEQVSEEARLHSRNMAIHRIGFGHIGFGKRIERLYKRVGNCQGGAENVAYNYKSAKTVVSEWIKSPGHRRNIVGNYNLTGIGIARDAQGKPYYTQIFLKTA